MKTVFGLGGLLVLLLTLTSGCEGPEVYGGAYGVAGEYPYAYGGTAYGYPYDYYSYPYPYYVPYDRDHYWDRDRYWEHHRWHGDYGWGHREGDRDRDRR